MPVGGYGEDALVERPAMGLLRDLNWETLSGYNEHPGAGGEIGRATFARRSSPNGSDSPFAA